MKDLLGIFTDKYRATKEHLLCARSQLDGTGTQMTKDRNSTPEEFTDGEERQQVTTAFMQELL